ncbi:MAG: hypothetical protein KDI73_06635 [Candidatus Competibacteraceae bacterium]|nr:hypothetical protein [Candidatus Competibacteraceae bacterium]MCP5451883.1 hypothetical protein [Gammaproteobacteria bacterium]
MPSAKTAHGRLPNRLQAHASAVRVDQWAQRQPAEAWRTVTVRDDTKGALWVEFPHRRVWLWKAKSPRPAHGI